MRTPAERQLWLWRTNQWLLRRVGPSDPGFSNKIWLLLIGSGVILLAAAGMLAQTATSQRLDGLTFHNFSDGTSGSSQRLGSFTFHHFSNGVSGTSQRVGSFTFHNFDNGLSDTSQKIGRFRFHNFSDGTSGTSQRVGRFTFHQFNKLGGRRGRTRTVRPEEAVIVTGKGP